MDTRPTSTKGTEYGAASEDVTPIFTDNELYLLRFLGMKEDRRSRQKLDDPLDWVHYYKKPGTFMYKKEQRARVFAYLKKRKQRKNKNASGT